jgi:hypothetical protein
LQSLTFAAAGGPAA